MNEKRRVERLNIELPATFKLKGDQEELSKATILDLSAIGICLSTPEELEVGRELQIQLMLEKEERPLVINSVVIWVKKVAEKPKVVYKAGIRLRDRVQVDEKRFIQFYAKHFLARHRPQSL